MLYQKYVHMVYIFYEKLSQSWMVKKMCFYYKVNAPLSDTNVKLDEKNWFDEYDYYGIWCGVMIWICTCKYEKVVPKNHI